MLTAAVTCLQLVQFSSNSVSAKDKGKGLLNMGNFLDTTNIDNRFDFSEWVRGYGKYLDEQLEVYRELNFYPVSCHSHHLRTCSIPIGAWLATPEITPSLGQCTDHE